MAANDASGNRLLDVALEDGAPRAPLSGLFPADLALPSLEDALMPLAVMLPHLHPSSGRSVKIARKQAKRAQAKHPNVSMDKCIAIVLYTLEEIPREDSLYYVLNLALRNPMRNAVRPWRDYVWLLLHALRELPPAAEMMVFRGCKTTPSDLGLELTAGFDFTWSSFSSTATKQEVMQTFVGSSGPRTLMTIKMTEQVGRDVRDFSLYPGENEILFPPNMCFEVVSSFDAGNQLIMVQCEQTETIDTILDLSYESKQGPSISSTSEEEEIGWLHKMFGTPRHRKIEAATKKAAAEKAAQEKAAAEKAAKEKAAAVEKELQKLRGTDVNKADGSGCTPLMRACCDGHDHVALALIKAKANLEATQNQGFTALMLSAQNGHEQCALELLKAGANLEATQNQGFTALMLSCERGHEQCALELIKAGANLEKVNKDSFTALMLSCQNGHEQCALELIKAGADPNVAQPNGWTALMQAAQGGHEQCALELIKAGANVNATEEDDYTALIFACQNGHEQCALELLKAGADPNKGIEKGQFRGWNPLMKACENGHEQCALELLKAGAAVDATEEDGWTALMFAAQNGHERCALELLKAGADPNKANTVGETPLIQACARGDEQCALELIKAGAAVDATEEDGYTALMFACQGDHEQCALELIKAGARKDLKNNSGHTALDYAKHNNHTTIVRILVS